MNQEKESHKVNTCADCKATTILSIISRQDFTDFNEGIFTNYLEDGNEEIKKEVLKRINYLFRNI